MHESFECLQTGPSFRMTSTNGATPLEISNNYEPILPSAPPLDF